VTRVTADGKFFRGLSGPFSFRGLDVPSGAEPLVLGRLGEAGFTVLRTDWPDAAALDRAEAGGLRLLARWDGRCWSELAGTSVVRRRRLVRAESARLGRAVGDLGASPALLGVSLPASSALSPAVVAQVLDELAEAVHDADPSTLVTVADDWPGLAECPPGLDFLTVDVDLSRGDDLRTVLSSAHRKVGDRPLVLGALRFAAGRASPDLRQVTDVALERGVAGMLVCSVTRHGQEGRPRGSLVVPDGPLPASLAEINRRDVRDLDVSWPAISVVVCAYNAEATLHECLSACEASDYPRLHVIVVDDGSTDATADIARSHPRARLVSSPHAGLSASRNAGYRAASGELVAYLDSDAWPPPQWPFYLALGGLDPAPREDVVGVGGPNVPPPSDPVAAHVVARSPGGPLPQLVEENRALHLPGCNLAIRRDVLVRLGGFDEALRTASDDLELQWRIADTGGRLGYHPAALVWHHRRPGLRPYLRQQRGYGRSQALVEARHEQRFPRGHRLDKVRQLLAGGRGPGSRRPLPVAYTSLLWRERPLLDLAHQWGMPAAALLLSTAPVAVAGRRSGLPALGAGAFVAALLAVDMVLAADGGRLPERSLRCRADIALHRVLRPLAFRWGHLEQRLAQRRGAAIPWRRGAVEAAVPVTAAERPSRRAET
jgi:O-antigen biosynthesis protein